MNFKEQETEQKLRGGYYTPQDLASFLVRWVSAKSPKKILEPSCGDGVFFSEIADHIASPEIHAFEILDTELKKAHERASGLGLNNTKIEGRDFLEWAVSAMKKPTGKYDAIVGNPPFIRYQYLPTSFQENAEKVFQYLGCKFTKHTNAWVPFILASMAMLKPGGRLAMVVPAEIIHVTHAQSLRTFLGKECSRLVIIDPEELWFEGTLQGAVLLMAEKKVSKTSQSQGLGIHAVRGREFIDQPPESIFQAPQAINGKTIEGKWTRAILSRSTLNLLDDLESRDDIKRFHEIADVKVGIVTGANKFFLVDDETIQKYGLEKWAHPMFGRSQHCPGIIYDQRQHDQNAATGKPTNFLWFKNDDTDGEIPEDYIAEGVAQELDSRYKCRIRKPWYSVPSVYATEIGMLKRSHNTPRLIHNSLQAYTTDTAYRVQTKEGTAKQLVYAFINGLTSLSAEIEGRHYGGGVLELIPSEINRLLMPLPSKTKPNLPALDDAIRTLTTEQVVEQQSAKVLGGLEISKADQAELHQGWIKLKNRRQRVSVESA